MVDDALAQAVAASLAPQAFFAPPEAPLFFAFEPEVSWRWEVLSGRLLDAALTRQEQRFAAWHVTQQLGPRREPRVSILLDADAGQLHVVRHLEIHGWEAYEPEPNVIESRQVQKWTRELVRSRAVQSCDRHDRQSLTAWCAQGIFHAICGTSRLPIASHESQLPAFALGLLGYWPSLAIQAEQGRGVAGDAVADHRETPLTDQHPIHEPRQLAWLALHGALPRWERAKLLEAALRAATGPQLDDVLACCARAATEHPALAAEFPRLIKSLFNGLGLTPYIPLEQRLVALLEQVAIAAGSGPLLDTVAFLLVQLVRHLTAFDLRTFHNYGADYPDLLLLDALLKWMNSWLERAPAEFLETESPGTAHADASPPEKAGARCQRRSAWLLASLLRKEHEGLPVTAVPTSPGENQRVLPQLPAGFAPPHVDDAEILEPRLRQNRLFEDDPLETTWPAAVPALLAVSASDLQQPAVLQTWGEALFLDRPLGVDRPPEAVDNTPLLSYVAFSRNMLNQRLRKLFQRGWIDDVAAEQLLNAAAALEVPGFPAAQLPGHPRPGVVSLEDAQLAGSDFVFVRTTRSSLSQLLTTGLLPLETLPADVQLWLRTGRDVLLIRTGQPGERQRPFLTAFDSEMQARAVFGFPETLPP